MNNKYKNKSKGNMQDNKQFQNNISNKVKLMSDSL